MKGEKRMNLELTKTMGEGTECPGMGSCKGNLANLRRELHLSLAKGNPK
jgi:hypothetical protein